MRYVGNGNRMDPFMSITEDSLPTRPDAVYRVNTAPRMRDLPKACRPREEADRVGIANISDASLLAILIQAGAPGCNVSELACRLLAVYGSLTELAKCSARELVMHKDVSGAKSFPGLGPVKAQQLLVALEAGRGCRREKRSVPPPRYANRRTCTVCFIRRPLPSRTRFSGWSGLIRKMRLRAARIV